VIANRSILLSLDKLGLAPSAIAQPDDVEDQVNAILRAEAEVQEEQTAAPPSGHLLINTVASARCGVALMTAKPFQRFVR